MCLNSSTRMPGVDVYKEEVCYVKSMLQTQQLSANTYPRYIHDRDLFHIKANCIRCSTVTFND
jgi:hypothetical protein